MRVCVCVCVKEEDSTHAAPTPMLRCLAGLVDSELRAVRAARYSALSAVRAARYPALSAVRAARYSALPPSLLPPASPPASPPTSSFSSGGSGMAVNWSNASSSRWMVAVGGMACMPRKKKDQQKGEHSSRRPGGWLEEARWEVEGAGWLQALRQEALPTAVGGTTLGLPYLHLLWKVLHKCLPAAVRQPGQHHQPAACTGAPASQGAYGEGGGRAGTRH